MFLQYSVLSENLLKISANFFFSFELLKHFDNSLFCGLPVKARSGKLEPIRWAYTKAGYLYGQREARERERDELPK